MRYRNLTRAALASVSTLTLIAVMPVTANATCTDPSSGSCTGTAGSSLLVSGGVGTVINTTTTFNGSSTGGAGYIPALVYENSGGDGIEITPVVAATSFGTVTLTGSVDGGAGDGNGNGIVITTGYGTLNVSGETVGGNTEGAYGINATGATAAVTINLNGGNTINGSTYALYGNAYTTVNFAGTNTLNGAFYYANNTPTTIASGGTVALGTTADTTITGQITLPGAILTNTIQSTQATSGQIDNSSFTGTNNLSYLRLEPLVVGVGLANGEKIVLIKNDNVNSAENVVGAAAQTYVGTYASSTIYNTLVRQWSLQDAGSAGWNGETDKWGSTIGAHDAVLLATIKSASVIVGDRTSGQTTAFDAAANYTGNGTLTDMVTLNQAMQNLNNVTDIRKAADQLRPEASGATLQASTNALNSVIHVDVARLESLRAAADGTGVAAGDASSRGGVWAQGFGGRASQSEQKGFTGYTSTAAGGAIGVDLVVGENGRIGVSGGYASSKVDESDNRSGDTLSLNSYIASLYGSYTGSVAYLDLIASAARHEYTSVRSVSVSDYHQTANGSFNGTQIASKVEVGVPYALGAGVILTPTGSVSYSRLTNDSYTETGGAGSDLTVSSRNLQELTTGFGGKLATTINLSDTWALHPSINAAWVHRFLNPSQNVTAAYAEDGSTFVTTGAVLSANGGVFGASLDVAHLGDVTGTLSYQGEIREGYFSNSGLVQVRYDF